jgi:hypothetical protein
MKAIEVNLHPNTSTGMMDGYLAEHGNPSYDSWKKTATLLLCHLIPPSEYLVPLLRVWLPFLRSWTFFLRGYSHLPYIYILPPLLTHCPPPSPCQNLSQLTTPPPSSWLARPFNTTHWTPLLYKHTFLTSWYPFYLKPWRWDKQVFPKRCLYTKNWRWATTQKLLSNITIMAEAFSYIQFNIVFCHAFYT